MAIPTFDLTNLFSAAARELPMVPDVRDYHETMPGADGEFVQQHGTGGRYIYVEGMLQSAAKASGALAHADFMSSLGTLQNLCGNSPATYVGTDGVSHTNCLLMSYNPIAYATTTPSGTDFVALSPCRAVLRQLTP